MQDSYNLNVTIFNQSIEHQMLQSGEAIPVKPFALSSDTKGIPSMFESVICIEDNFYRFGFEADGTSVVSEWLYVRSSKKRSKEIELFYRDGLKCDIHLRFGIGKELTDRAVQPEKFG